MFKLLSDDEICVVNFGENNFDSEYFKVKDFYDKLTINKFYEGIVIKPNFIVKNMAPFLKVRNENYLTLIYGPDYLSKFRYDKLMKKKKIDKKLNISIREFNLGLKLLEFRRDDINEDNYEYIGTLLQFLYQEEILNNEVDPRL